MAQHDAWRRKNASGVTQKCVGPPHRVGRLMPFLAASCFQAWPCHQPLRRLLDAATARPPLRCPARPLGALWARIPTIAWTTAHKVKTIWLTLRCRTCLEPSDQAEKRERDPRAAAILTKRRLRPIPFTAAQRFADRCRMPGNGSTAVPRARPRKPMEPESGGNPGESAMTQRAATRRRAVPAGRPRLSAPPASSKAWEHRREEACPGPLHGYRVVDLTSMVSGPLATMILGDQGADVIKVEAPDGRPHARRRQPPRRLLGAFPQRQPQQALDRARPEGPARRSTR